MDNENAYISLCRKRIEQTLNLESGGLSQRDFEYLHRVVLEKSRTDLSTATLRRVWSNQHSNTPQIKTLDALAIVLDYEGWHEFKKANPLNSKRFTFAKIKKVLWLILIAIGSISGWLLYGKFDSNIPIVALEPEKVIHEGVPATIGIVYDISEASEEVQIQLSWNPYERVTLDPSKNFYSGTYYYPDYHQTKLLSNNSILTKKSIHITTVGWHGLLMQSGFDSNPIYLDPSDFSDSIRLRTKANVDSLYSLETKEYFSVFTLSNKVLEQLSGESFGLKTVIKSTDPSIARTCKETAILIKGEHGSMRIPISSEGCYGPTVLSCADVRLSGKTNDLSQLSSNLEVELPIEIESKNKTLKIKVGDNSEFLVNYNDNIGPLKVVKFIFMGYGEVSTFEMTGADDNQLVDPVLSPF